MTNRRIYQSPKSYGRTYNIVFPFHLTFSFSFFFEEFLPGTMIGINRLSFNWCYRPFALVLSLSQYAALRLPHPNGEPPHCYHHLSISLGVTRPSGVRASGGRDDSGQCRWWFAMPLHLSQNQPKRVKGCSLNDRIADRLGHRARPRLGP